MIIIINIITIVLGIYIIYKVIQINRDLIDLLITQRVRIEYIAETKYGGDIKRALREIYIEGGQ